jgi:hypothetical protein
MRERKNKMELREKLLDLTNYDWQLHSRDGSYLWVEDGQSLEVIVSPIKNDKNYVLSVRNVNGGPEIKLEPSQVNDYLLTAIHYAQFADSEHGFPEGSVENFWQLAAVFTELGGEPNFAKSTEGIYCHAGEENVFVEYRDNRYVLFDNGIHYYAATPRGLKRAYDKLAKELIFWRDLETKREAEKSQS